MCVSAISPVPEPTEHLCRTSLVGSWRRPSCSSFFMYVCPSRRVVWTTDPRNLPQLNQVQQKSFRQHLSEFDFVGLFLVTAGTFVLLLGFNSGETSWSSPRTIAYLTTGFALLLLCAVVEAYLHLTKSKRTPIIPPRLFQTRTTTCLSISGFITWSVWFTIMLYCPIYFQVLGASATKSGLMLIPFAFGSCIVAAIVGVVITHTGSYRPIIWIGAVRGVPVTACTRLRAPQAVLVLAMGLMSLLDEKSSM